MLELWVLFVSYINAVLSLQLIELPLPTNDLDDDLTVNSAVVNCAIGYSVSSDCVECTCNGKWYSCSPKVCDKEVIPDTEQQICPPNMIFKLNSATCTCTSKGRWSVDSCSRTLGHLPPDKVRLKRCDPDSYVILDCNVCKCNPNGIVDTKKCTKNVCEMKSRRTSVNKVSGNCVPENWYSFAPCQFCYCVNTNKLVCNTGSKRDEAEITLGAYKLTVCDSNLMKEATGLVPDSQVQSDLPLPPLNKQLREGTLNTPKIVEPPNAIHNTLENTISEAVNSFQLTPNTKSITPPSTNDADTNFRISNAKESSESQKTPKPKAIISGVSGTGATSTTTTTERYYSDDSSSESEEIEIPAIYTAPTPVPSESPIMSLSMAPKPTALPVSLTDVTNKGSYQVNLEDTNIIENTLRIPNKDNTVRINFPMVLDKILNLALRKSNVKLDSVANCEVGTTTKIGCNACFCLVNGKQLCTDKNCT